MQRKPCVIPVSIEAQAQVVDKSIPIMLRNQQTGWPLLQVSYLMPAANGGCEPVLGGGKCHYFPIAIFAFAELISRLPGKREIDGPSWSLAADYTNLEEFRLSNVHQFLASFNMRHKKLGIEITMNASEYGKIPKIIITGTDNQRSVSHLAERLSHALNNAVSCYLKETASWDHAHQQADQYNETEIWARLNREYAIYYQGQIYIDLSLYLQSKKIYQRADDSDIPAVSAEVLEFLASVFKVEAFKALQLPEQEAPQAVRGAKLLSMQRKEINLQQMKLFGGAIVGAQEAAEPERDARQRAGKE